MNFPIDTCENGACSFAIRGEYDKRVYRQRPCAWCINCSDGCACTLTLHYHKEGWSNFLTKENNMSNEVVDYIKERKGGAK